MLRVLAPTLLPASAFALEIATFSVDVTPPLGHQLLTGGGLEATAVSDPLYARGFVLSGEDFDPVVFVAVDWAEIRNEAYDRWRDALAEAAATRRERVLVSSVHPHDAPLADLEAQRLLEEVGAEAQVIDLEFHEKTVRRVAAAAREGLGKRQTVTHVGTGEAEVVDVASNRRYLTADGKVSYGRYSGGSDLAGRLAGTGTIDPMLKTLSFWNGDLALCALSIYATHPMSYYRTGRISADFPGRARARRQEETPGTLQIYASGASGNVTVGKFNDPARKEEMRGHFGDRIHSAMVSAWETTAKHEVGSTAFRTTPLYLEPRPDSAFLPDALEEQLRTATKRSAQSAAALGLSWRRRCERGQPIDTPVVDLGVAQLVLLPAEAYVEFQLFAQDLRPESFVLVAGYGECGPGYIPIERSWEEQDGNLDSWCWIAPNSEERIKRVLRILLTP